MTPDAWETFYRWEWSRRSEWLPGFCESKRRSCEPFARAQAAGSGVTMKLRLHYPSKPDLTREQKVV